MDLVHDGRQRGDLHRRSQIRDQQHTQMVASAKTYKIARENHRTWAFRSSVTPMSPDVSSWHTRAETETLVVFESDSSIRGVVALNLGAFFCIAVARRNHCSTHDARRVASMQTGVCEYKT